MSSTMRSAHDLFLQSKVDSTSWMINKKQTKDGSLQPLVMMRTQEDASLSKDVLNIPGIGRHADGPSISVDDSLPELSPCSTSTSASSSLSFASSTLSASPAKQTQVNVDQWQGIESADKPVDAQDDTSSASVDGVPSEVDLVHDHHFDSLIAFLKLERSLPTPIDYASSVQQDFKSTDRFRLVSFLHASAISFGFKLHTCRVALLTFDRFMSQWSVKDLYLELTAICCISLAAQVTENCDDGIRRMASYNNGRYSYDELTDMEALIRTTLDSHIIDVTSHAALLCYQAVFSGWMPAELIEVSSQVMDCSYYLPEEQLERGSTLAMAAMLSALVMTAHYVQAYEFTAHCQSIMGNECADSIWSIACRLCARFDETHQLRAQAAADRVELASAASVLEVPIAGSRSLPRQSLPNNELSDITRSLQFDDAVDDDA